MFEEEVKRAVRQVAKHKDRIDAIAKMETEDAAYTPVNRAGPPRIQDTTEKVLELFDPGCAGCGEEDICESTPEKCPLDSDDKLIKHISAYLVGNKIFRHRHEAEREAALRKFCEWYHKNPIDPFHDDVIEYLEKHKDRLKCLFEHF
jgi:hypothetical protein